MTSLSIICALLVGAIVIQAILHHRERREADAERRLLILHIQAPETAIAESVERPERGRVQVVSPLDDETLNKVRAQRGEAA